MKQFKSRIDVERDVNDIEREIRDECDLEDNWYGDCYGVLIESSSGLDLMTCAEFAKNEEEYNEYLKEIENNFRREAIRIKSDDVQELLDRIKELDWEVTNEENNHYSLSQFSPAGQDFNIEITGENVDELIQSIYKTYENYDVNEEAYLWLDDSGHGINGAPYEMEDVLEDMKWCKNAMLELYSELRKVFL